MARQRARTRAGRAPPKRKRRRRHVQAGHARAVEAEEEEMDGDDGFFDCSSGVEEQTAARVAEQGAEAVRVPLVAD